MGKVLLSELSYGEEKVFEGSVKLYNEASRIEKLLLTNGAVSGEDYTYLDLFKLAIEKLKAGELENIATWLRSIDYQLEVRNEIERKK
jgi:hypothetical protein